MFVELSQHLLFLFIVFSIQPLVWGFGTAQAVNVMGCLSSTQCSGIRGPPPGI